MNEHVTQKRKLQKNTVFPQLGKADSQSSATHLSDAVRHVLSMPTRFQQLMTAYFELDPFGPAVPPPPTSHIPLA